jgi:acyl carrier protein
MSEKIFEKLKSMLATQLTIDATDIKPQTEIIGELGADSLDLVEMLMNIEAEWGLTIEDNEIEGIVTVQDAVDLIDKKLR